MPLQTESTSVLAKDWHRQPTSVAVEQSSSAAHNDFVSTSWCRAHEQLMHELPVDTQQLVSINRSNTSDYCHNENNDNKQ